MKKHPTHSTLPKTFWWHNFAQFGGALNDNLFKLLMIYALLSWQVGVDSAGVLASVGLVFAGPFLLFLPLAGGLADFFSKRQIIRGLKIAEVGIMVFGVTAFWLHSIPMLYVTMFLMASQSALYGPCKYGIIPEQVPVERLSRANGVIQMFTFLAIIFGTILAPELSLLSDQNFALAGSLCIVVALVGLFAAYQISPTPAHRDGRTLQLNGFKTIGHSLGYVRRDGFLVLTLAALAIFGLTAAFVQLNLLDYGHAHLGLMHEQATRLFLLTALGIGLGALIAGWLSGRSIEFGIVPIGAGLMAVSLAILGLLPAESVAAAAITVGVLGFGAGLFVVPLESFLQFRSPADRLGSIQATASFLSWLGILFASAVLYTFSAIGWGPEQGFLVLSFGLFGLTILSLWVLPDFFGKFIIMLITRAIYKLRINGLENVPVEGGALLVSNHVSMMDAMLIAAGLQRRPRMLMSREFYENANWFTRRIADLLKVILIHGTDKPKQLIRSLQVAREALDDGYLVCIFAEGALTRTGMMRPFKPGFERILKGSEYPIIPIYIGGAWGSVASYRHGMPKIRPLRDFRYPMSVHFGQPLPTASTAFDVQQAVRELSVDAYEAKRSKRLSLGQEWVRSARRNWNKVAMVESTGARLTYGKALIASRLLAERLSAKTRVSESPIGILLPNGQAAMLVNLALAISQRVTVNLNYTVPENIFVAALRLADIRTVVTSRKFVERFPDLPLPENILYVEDLLADISNGARIRHWFSARFSPVNWLCNIRHFDSSNVATVLFSSGSTAEPKGVMLSHHNLLSNIEAFRTVLAPHRDDVLLAALPLFHSFGYTANFWFPLLTGLTIASHYNPLEAEVLGTLAAEQKATILLCTPSFLIAYTRKIRPEQLASLRYVFTGAEKLQLRVANLFEKKFGVQPLEGYGATELSPVCALSLPNVTIDALDEEGHRPDRLGRVLPGMAIRILDPDTGALLGPGEEGMICIKGPNVMRGYLKQEALTAKAIQDGWYHTGDIGILDADGFFAITDRLARFSKIGGEMVSHGAVEKALQEALGFDSSQLAVVAVPDERKSERLHVLHIPLPADADSIPDILRNLTIPNLWKPSAKDWIQVEALPLLGSGKLDYPAMKQTVQSR